MPWNRVFSCLIDVAELIFLVEANELIFTIIEGASSSAFGLARFYISNPQWIIPIKDIISKFKNLILRRGPFLVLKAESVQNHR